MNYTYYPPPVVSANGGLVVGVVVINEQQTDRRINMSATKTKTGVVTQPPAKLTRDQMREKIFSSNNPERNVRKLITLYGVEVELRRATLGAILDRQDDTNRKKALVNMMCQYCYVPGTDDKVFEETDFDSILNLPFNNDLAALNQAILELNSIDVMGQEKNS
jgi:hypothetical protein